MQSSKTNYYHQQQLFGISEQLKQQIKHGEVLKIPLVYHYGVSAGFLLFFRKITKKIFQKSGRYYQIGCFTWTRTKIDGVRIRCPTIRR